MIYASGGSSPHRLTKIVLALPTLTRLNRLSIGVVYENSMAFPIGLRSYLYFSIWVIRTSLAGPYSQELFEVNGRKGNGVRRGLPPQVSAAVTDPDRVPETRSPDTHPTDARCRLLPDQYKPLDSPGSMGYWRQYCRLCS